MRVCGLVYLRLNFKKRFSADVLVRLGYLRFYDVTEHPACLKMAYSESLAFLVQANGCLRISGLLAAAPSPSGHKPVLSARQNTLL